MGNNTKLTKNEEGETWFGSEANNGEEERTLKGRKEWYERCSQMQRCYDNKTLTEMEWQVKMCLDKTHHQTE